MSCPAIHTSERFLAATLAHLDCQAATIGSFGFGALSAPGSSFALAFSGLITLFIAFFGVRLLIGSPLSGHEFAHDMVRVAIALTLATSWPAWRTLGYDVVISGPDELFRAIGLASGLPGSSGDLASRLQRVDDGLGAFNVLGSGRLGVATGDWFQLSFARGAYLIGTIVPLALVRLAAGLMLALAPIIAGLSLFGASRSLFDGWARALVMIFLASLAVSLVLAAQLAIVEPWLQDALARRSAEQATLDAPLEIMALTTAFALVSLGLVALTARIAFHSQSRFSVTANTREAALSRTSANANGLLVSENYSATASRAQRIANALGESELRGDRAFARTLFERTAGVTVGGTAGSKDLFKNGPNEALGFSYRRNVRRNSAAGNKRDARP